MKYYKLWIHTIPVSVHVALSLTFHLICQSMNHRSHSRTTFKSWSSCSHPEIYVFLTSWNVIHPINRTDCIFISIGYLFTFPAPLISQYLWIKVHILSNSYKLNSSVLCSLACGIYCHKMWPNISYLMLFHKDYSFWANPLPKIFLRGNRRSSCCKRTVILRWQSWKETKNQGNSTV